MPSWTPEHNAALEMSFIAIPGNADDLMGSESQVLPVAEAAARAGKMLEQMILNNIPKGKWVTVVSGHKWIPMKEIDDG